MSDIICVGEALVYFVSSETEVTLRQASVFEKMAGGTQAEVAVGVARLGVSSGFIGRVGDDPFGHFLADTLAANSVDVSQLGFERKSRTGLAFISPSTEGEPDALLYRHPSADKLLSPGHINPNYIKHGRAVVFGSTGLIDEPSRSGVLKALAIAHDAGLVRVYDVNLQASLWSSESEARYGLRLGLDRADVVIFSPDELEFLSDTRELMAGTERLWRVESLPGDGMYLSVVTLGRQGCAYRTATDFSQLPGYRLGAVDTTGTRVGFLASLLAELVCVDFSFERENIERALRFANAAGALTATQLGAIPGLPTRAQVMTLLANSD